MLSNNKYKTSGFSIIEAMVAMLVVSISFVGVYTLTAYATTNLKNSMDRQKIQIVANSIFETLHTRTISDYNNLNLKDCSTPQSSDDHALDRYAWCNQLNSYIGAAQTSDIRRINVSSYGTNFIVTVTIQSKSNKVQVVLKKIYYVS